MGVWLTSHGYAVACLNYRLSGEATFPAQIEDCKAAVRWLRAHAAEYGLDADRIGAIGHSAGAHLATLLATSGDAHGWDVGEHLEHPSSIRAVVASAGPTDFLQMDDHAPAGARLRHRSAGSPESRLIGEPIEENPEQVARANPITYASAGDPPCLLVHGDEDATVPVHQSRLLDEALRRVGVPVELIVLPGVGHRIGDDLPTDRVVAFFDEHLRR